MFCFFPTLDYQTETAEKQRANMTYRDFFFQCNKDAVYVVERCKKLQHAKARNDLFGSCFSKICEGFICESDIGNDIESIGMTVAAKHIH